MATDALSGNYDYSSLVRELKNEGVTAANLTGALNQIADDNNISDIKNIDGSEEITINSSVFDQYASETNSTVPMAVPTGTDEVLSAYMIDYELEDGSTNVQLPPIYSDDDYEVVDYEDYYNFGSGDEGELPDPSIDPDSYAQQYADENGITLEEAKEYLASLYGDPENNAENSDIQIDFETFKKDYASQFVTNTLLNDDDYLENIFNTFDADSNEYLDAQELSAAYYSAAAAQQKDVNTSTDVSTGGEDLLEGAMDMDMSGDSFNPQG